MTNNSNYHKIQWFIVLFLIFIQISCKTTYNLGVEKAKPLTDAKLYRNLIDSSLHYESLFIKKLSASYSVNGVKKSFKGSLKIQKDSLIWISITAPVGGLEVARLMISQDSVKLIDRLKKQYFIDDYDFFRDNLNVDMNFEALQAIITNSVFKASNEEKEKAFIRDFNGRIIDNMYVFTSEKPKKVDRKLRKDKLKRLSRFGYQRIDIDPSLMRITDVLVKDFDDGSNINVKYRDFTMFEDRKFPQRLSFEVVDPKHSLSCNIKFNKISFDEELSFSFKISSKYERIYP